MKRLMGLLTGLALLLAGLTACSTVIAGSPTATGSSAAARPAFGAYIDVSVARPDLAAVAKQTGLKHVNLAFALAAGGRCEPVWGGSNQPIGALKGEIDAFRAVGGSVSAATGGAVGTYLENACGSAADLAGAYEKVLDGVATNLLDVDIETGVDTAKVVDALSQVQRKRGTDITFTLPVDLGGLPAQSLDLVQKAAAAGVTVSVNAMDMNFRTGGNWGQAMVDAAQATLDQLRRVYPNASEAAQNRTLAITIEIGRNDVAGVITQPDDAQKVLDFAKSRGVGRLGFWSLGRDNGACPQKVKAQPTCSGIAQQDFQFTREFATFTGPGAA